MRVAWIVLLTLSACKPTPDHLDRSASGTLAVTAVGASLGYTELRGRAELVREDKGDTRVLLVASGLRPSAEYGAHVHVDRCEDGGGGPHYQIDRAVLEVEQANEIWPVVESDASGNGVGYLRVHHHAREDAASVVIHETGGIERIACANLDPDAGAALLTALDDALQSRFAEVVGSRFSHSARMHGPP